MTNRRICLVLLLTILAGCQREPSSIEAETTQEAHVDRKVPGRTDPVGIDVNVPQDILGWADANIFCWIDISTFEPLAGNLTKIARAVDINRWPQTNVRRTAPLFDVSLLERPELVKRVNDDFGFLSLCDGVWGHQNWRGKGDGWLWVRIYLSPNSRAAHEVCMLGTMTPLPSEAWIWHYSKATGPNDLGDLSFDRFSSSRTDRRVEFFRDNLYVNIRGTGVFLDEVLPLARKLDRLIQQQPALTYEQLLARRPKVVIHDYDPDVRTRLGGKALRYAALGPVGTQVVWIHATHNGAFSGAADGLVYLNKQEGPACIEFTAITDELLASTTNRDVVIPP